MPSAIDPTFPADGTPVSKPAFRDQLLTLRAELEHGGFVTNPVTLAESTASQALADLHAVIPGAQVETIADLRAIPPTPGRIIEVLGHAAPGDGGGGLFYADQSGAQTDGGIVFGCTADESAEQVVSGRTAASFITGFSLPHTDLVFGSVVIDPDSSATAVTFPDLDLHGHRLGTGGHGLFPLIDHKAGTIAADAQKRLNNYLNTYGDGTTTATVRYKHLSQARRWVRLTDGRSLDVRWFGVSDDGTDQRDRLCWALNAAKRLGFREVRLNGSYRYHGGIELPDGIDFGWGKLTVVDGLALEHLRTDWETAYPDGTVRKALGGSETCICPEDDAAAWGLHALELDGNYQNNLAPLENGAAYGREGGVITVLQNTPCWGGFSTNNHGGRVVPNPQRGVLENVDIHGYGAACLLGHGHTHISGRNVRLGDSVKNHVFYSPHGVFHDLTCYGFAWGAYGKSEHAQFVGLHFKRLRGFDFNADGFTAATQLLNFEGMRRGNGSLLTGLEAERWRHIGLNISGGQWDLQGLPSPGGSSGPLITGSGQHLSARDVTILGPVIGESTATGLSIADQVDINDTEFKEGWSFKNITVMQRGIPLTWTGDKDVKGGVLTLEDASFQDLRGYEAQGAAAGRLTTVIADTPRPGPNALIPRDVVISRVRTIRPFDNFVKLDVRDAAATPVDLIVRDCSLLFTNNTILRSENGTGTIAGMTIQDLTKIRVLMENTRFTLGASTNWQDLELFFALTSFRNCVTMDGLKSEDGATVAFDAAGGETVLDVPTSLLWAPGVVHVTPHSAATASRFSHVEMLASDGSTPVGSVADRRQPVLRIHFATALGAGESVRLGWDAAVRPF